MSQLPRSAAVLACALLSACGDDIESRLAWGVGVAQFDKVSFSRTDLVPHLEIPTYDGSGQVVHPDVLFDGYRYLLAYTPYPFSNGRFENPSIAISDDGLAFREIAPGVNPIAPAPP
ncbi:MAG: hypothetical protein H0T46_01550 [Deltaproteobacteria bacterium]|nr:hypothetical protein [Deltaproteobacteria bacterium]